MKITAERIEISTSELILWGEVKSLRLLNNKLALVLSNNQVIEFSDLHPLTIDLIFRSYDKYVKDHPKKRKARGKRL